MKPTKNHIFCPFCYKPKIVFESKKKAMNFIRFNADEIMAENGYAPVRAYFCPACGGWHVTSRKSLQQIETEQFESRVLDLELSLIEINKAIGHGKYDECKRLIADSVQKFNDIEDTGYCSIRLRKIKNELSRIIDNLIIIEKHKAA